MIQFDIKKEIPSIIKAIGVGGGGSNAVNHMHKLGIKGVEFVICNTDAQALEISPVPIKIQLGTSLTEGRGAGSIPEIGKNAAIENIDDIRNFLKDNTKMVFITAGMGGGTGTGAAPIIAGVAKEMGILTVAICTVPFSFEGKKRRQQAEIGIEELKRNVDTLLVINNDKLREIHGNLKLADAFALADNVLSTAARSIAEVISNTLHINVDFADVQTVMKDSGAAIMGSATASGENRAIRAVEQALDSPLLNDNNIEGARYILLNITSGNEELTMDEMGDITDFVQEKAGQTAEIIMGVGTEANLGDKVNVTLIATGFKTREQIATPKQKPVEKIVHRLNDPLPVEEKKEEPRHVMEVFNEPVLKTIEPIAENPVNEPVLKLTPSVFETPIVKVPVVKAEELPVKEETIIPEAKTEEPVLMIQEEVKQEEEKPIIFELEVPEMNITIEEENKTEETVMNEEIKDVVAEIPAAPIELPKPEVKPQEEEKYINPAAVIDEDLFRRTRERIMKLKELSYKMNTPNGIVDLEKEPAYKRKNVRLDNVPASSENNISRYSLSDEGDKRPEIKPNNSFLHDRVD